MPQGGLNFIFITPGATNEGALTVRGQNEIIAAARSIRRSGVIKGSVAAVSFSSSAPCYGVIASLVRRLLQCDIWRNDEISPSRFQEELKVYADFGFDTLILPMAPAFVRSVLLRVGPSLDLPPVLPDASVWHIRVSLEEGLAAEEAWELVGQIK